MKKKLKTSLVERLKTEIAPQNPVKFLKELDVDVILDTAISVVYLYTRTSKSSRRKFILLSEIITAIGHRIRSKYNLKKDSALAAKAGAFVLFTFEAYKLIKVKIGAGTNGHSTYMVDVDDDEELSRLWDNVSEERSEKLPSLEPYTPWQTSRHPTGKSLVKTNSREVLEQLTVESHPIVFNVVNAAQAVGWRINKEVFPLVAWALRSHADAFSSIWELKVEEAKASKFREAHAINSMAKKFLDKTFYHLYSLDFRGRKYPATAYLHEQGSDLARGLLLRDDAKPITREGLDWLYISLASNWAGDAGRPDGRKTDKIPLLDRIQWAKDNEEIFLDYAKNPKVSQGWMKADAPWQFLAACIELLKLRQWQHQFWEPLSKDDTPPKGDEIDSYLIALGVDPYDYESHLECFIDGLLKSCR